MGVPMKWEIARIFVVGTGGKFCAEAAPAGVMGFMAVAPYSSFGILLFLIMDKAPKKACMGLGEYAQKVPAPHLHRPGLALPRTLHNRDIPADLRAAIRPRALKASLNFSL
jgi:hypothetical protein